MHILQKVLDFSSIFIIVIQVSIGLGFPDCDNYHDLDIGQEYRIYSIDYPRKYPPYIYCRWIVQSPRNTVIMVTCNEIDIPESPNCESDRLSISLTGDETFKDALHFCGKNSTTQISEDNFIAIAIAPGSHSPGGRVMCTLTPKSVQAHDLPTSTTGKPGVCDCGWKIETRNEYPSMAAIVDANTRDEYCGASIITNRYALTAAHCLLHKVPGDLSLLVGVHTTRDNTVYKISEFKAHPQYNQSTQLNDIAILKTEKPIEFSRFVGPLCLPFKYINYDFEFETVTALGWSVQEFSGNKSDTLKEVDLSVVSNAECKASTPDLVTSKQICTYAENKDTCLSDSGGPLIFQDSSTKELQLVGVISYGIGCASGKPAVNNNTRVTSYLDWIVKETNVPDYCIQSGVVL